MNGINTSNEDSVECPLCMEPLEVDDLNFYPCTCGYQICRFCWHRIRTDENKLCPACRKEYPENPADFTPLTQEEMIAFKSQKRQRDQQRKQKITENRKHLANVRVVQKNLVFVVGLPPRLADADVLKKHEYFGKFGKIHKVVINPSTTYAGVQGPSASAYVTYVHNSDALRAIQSVNNIMIDGRLIKTSLGTTKYCSHFMKNQQCPKSDCMYLHELGDPDASFTKEEMHQGKHQEYEKRLHDTLIASGGLLATTTATCNGLITITTGKNGVGDCKTTISTASANSLPIVTTTTITTALCVGSGTGGGGGTTASSVTTTNKDAWPSLSTSPKENSSNLAVNVKSKKDKTKQQEKVKNEKNARMTAKAQQNAIKGNAKTKDSSRNTPTTFEQEISKSEKSKEKSVQQRKQNLDDELHQIAENEEQINKQDESMRSVRSSSNSSSGSSSRSESSSSGNDSSVTLSESCSGKSSPGDFVDSVTETETKSDANETDVNKQQQQQQEKQIAETTTNTTTTTVKEEDWLSKNVEDGNSTTSSRSGTLSSLDSTKSSKSSAESLLLTQNNTFTDTSAALSKLNLFDDNNSFFSSSSSTALQQSLLLKNKYATLESRANQSNLITSQLPDLLNGIDGFQSSSNSNEWEDALKALMLKNNRQIEEQLQQQQQQFHQQHLQQQHLNKQQHQRNNLLNIGMPTLTSTHLDFPTFSNNTDSMRLSQQALLQQQQQQLLQQQSTHNSDLTTGGNGLFELFNFHKNQQQQQQQQQQIQQQQYLMNGLSGNNAMSDHLRMANLLENNRLNLQYLDQPNGLLQKHRFLGKLDSMQQQSHSVQQPIASATTTTATAQTQNRLSSQYAQNLTGDDDLGFDPFIETQKALAELIENEQNSAITTTSTTTSAPAAAATSSSTTNNKLLQQQQQQQQQHLPPTQQIVQQPQHQQQNMLDNLQRARMPPPGFNHMNTAASAGGANVGYGGFGMGRTPSQNTSKLLPMVNMPASNNAGGGGPGVQSLQQQQIQLPNSWNPHLSYQPQQQQQALGEAQLHAINQTGGNNLNKGGFCSNDWTSMDPAILSYRQFSFPQQPQQLPPPHHPQQADMFMQHLAGPQQQPGSFNAQPTQFNAAANGLGLPNGLLNSQQNSQAQVNFSHSNWLNSEQSLFMNSLANGFTNNNYDKFSIPMPPGIHPGNLNKQQKTECIN